ncbi:hypothetical protein MMC26_000436 [Xylographa opegraphella]|nr:hypothetical protein [Xylographa opegraphella]
MEKLHQTAQLTFLQWQDLYNREKPFELVTEIPSEALDQRRTNLVFHTVGTQAIEDVRGDEEQYTLDRHGFTYRRAPFAFAGFHDKSQILETFLPWAERILRKEVEDVGRVFIFDWRLRRSNYVPRRVDLSELHQFLPVSTTCHVDQSPWEMLKRCQKFLGTDAGSLLKGRVRIINLWRPLYHTIEDRPLTVTDGSTVNAADLIRTDYVRRDDVQETMYLMHNSKQKWYYLSQQTTDEVLLLKIYDSSDKVAARSKTDVRIFPTSE